MWEAGEILGGVCVRRERYSKKRFPPLFELKLSENRTVTPIVSWKVMRERRLQWEKERHDGIGVSERAKTRMSLNCREDETPSQISEVVV